MLVAPCKDCKDRHRLCHSDCEKYIEFRKAKTDLNNLKYKEKRRTDDYLRTLRGWR